MFLGTSLSGWDFYFVAQLLKDKDILSNRVSLTRSSVKKIGANETDDVAGAVVNVYLEWFQVGGNVLLTWNTWIYL